jgi:hypothetical protein
MSVKELSALTQLKTKDTHTIHYITLHTLNVTYFMFEVNRNHEEEPALMPLYQTGLNNIWLIISCILTALIYSFYRIYYYYYYYYLHVYAYILIENAALKYQARNTGNNCTTYIVETLLVCTQRA